MGKDLLRKIRRGLRKPPKVIAERILQELRAEAERFIAPVRDKNLDESKLMQLLGFRDMNACWHELGRTSFASSLGYDSKEFLVVCPTDKALIFQAAERALEHQVNLLGSGWIFLGEKIDWHKDYKSGFDWPAAYFRDIEYTNLGRASDVKFPWEVSRLQWMIPAGQAYVLTQDECYAYSVREILEQWMEANPYAHSINWACTMEVALRIITWTWFFHIFNGSDAWKDEAFRAKFLRMLYLHGDFTSRHLEKSDVNGNHYVADAAGLVFAGLFFSEKGHAAYWQQLGWKILSDELLKQVHADGVDYEASIPYHRLVLELFLFPALYRMKRGLEISPVYRARLLAMARFTAAYSRADGTIPLFGDADDARVLPFGYQTINDHRYLLGLTGGAFDDGELKKQFTGGLAEIYWWLGGGMASALNHQNASIQHQRSQAFPDGGVYIMRNEQDHIFIDCGPLGLAGRGGHGHNDALSFEAALQGVHLITDSGAYIYTADYLARNRFRSTSSHNTPMVDGQEINRFIRPDYLWNLHDDARPELMEWETSDTRDFFKGKHSAYTMLDNPVTPVRSIELDHAQHRLVIEDVFEGVGVHSFEIPLHLAPAIMVEETSSSSLCLHCADKAFALHWHGDGLWVADIEKCSVSPSYGRLLESSKIVWRCRADARYARLIVTIKPIG